MKVLLKQDVDNLGYAGELHEVANGYGRNFLIPKGLAVKATPGVLKQAAAWRARAEARRAELRAEYEGLSERIKETHLVFHARAGEGGRLYGSVTMMDIAERLQEELGAEIDRRKFDSQPLRDLGEHHVTIHLDRDFHPQIQVFIHPEGEIEAEDALATEAAESEDVEEGEEAFVDEEYDAEAAFDAEESFDAEETFDAEEELFTAVEVEEEAE
jgi:large subunit ribosomal protein L9